MLKPKLVLAILSVTLLIALWIAIRPYQNVQIYKKALDQVLEVDDTYGGSLKPRKVLLSSKLLTLENLLTENGNSGQLSQVEMEFLVKHLSQKGVLVKVVESPQESAYTSDGELVGGGVLLILSPIEQNAWGASITASIYKASLASGGTTYFFHKWVTGWRLYRHKLAWIS